MKFLIDAQLPPALAVWLQQAGHEATHVRDVGLGDAEDAAIWEHAEARLAGTVALLSEGHRLVELV